MPLLYALLVLTAQPAPLKVRILERSKPYQATLEAAALTCDGKPLKSPSVELTLKDRRIDASGTSATPSAPTAGSRSPSTRRRARTPAG
ncbi:MAG: hypothetical protein IPJ65_00480 [Archangiaceae bacterium]|nr:hypothetical protein [Archangiaceae bacterium]